MLFLKYVSLEEYYTFFLPWIAVNIQATAHHLIFFFFFILTKEIPGTVTILKDLGAVLRTFLFDSILHSKCINFAFSGIIPVDIWIPEYGPISKFSFLCWRVLFTHKTSSAHAISFTLNTLHTQNYVWWFLLLHDIYHLIVSLVKCQGKEKKAGVFALNEFQKAHFASW